MRVRSFKNQYSKFTITFRCKSRILFPEVRLFINKIGQGSVASRHRMMQEARGELVLAIDDDSYPEQLNCLEILSGVFEARPRLAIASFPQRTDEYPQSLQQTDFGSEMPVRSFANSGACLRVSAYRSLPGFEPIFSISMRNQTMRCNAWRLAGKCATFRKLRFGTIGSGANGAKSAITTVMREMNFRARRCGAPCLMQFCSARIGFFPKQSLQ